MIQQERRRHPRVAVVTRVTHLVSGTSHYYYSRDLSLGGMFLETKKPYPVGTRLLLDFSLPELESRIRAEAEVKRTVESKLGDYEVIPGMGLAFVNLEPSSREAIKAFLLQRIGQD